MRNVQRLLAQIPGCEVSALVSLLPLSAAPQSAIRAGIFALRHKVTMPETDYLLNLDQVTTRPDKSTKRVREHTGLFPPALVVGQRHRFTARVLGACGSDRCAM